MGVAKRQGGDVACTYRTPSHGITLSEAKGPYFVRATRGPQLAVQLRQQVIRPPHMRNHDAPADHQCHVDGFFLFGT